ncbi:GNAT family N-acetyltransferase [Parasphingorhabdus sp.]|uniref:GNAT family N-acetyltransferase n=1 Tax=Parasphingorhabdus sp. TaxID=2709688 RepID=UPI00326438D1
MLLRPGWPEDAPALHAAISDEQIVRNLATAPWPYNLNDAETFLDLPREASHANFLIFRRTAGAPQLVGGIGLEQTDTGSVEIGYWLSRPNWGLGYATEAGHAVIDIARALGHRHMGAEHYVDNPASGNVLRKLGFRSTGRIAPRYSLGRKAQVDAIQFRLDLADDDESEVMPLLAA